MIPSGFYKHYKGKVYFVSGMAKHSETLEDMVVYSAVYNSLEFGNNATWVRPAAMFLEEIEVDGKKVQRFTYIDKCE
jgi:hypothetical protein